MEVDKDGLRLWARPSEELGAVKVFISLIYYGMFYSNVNHYVPKLTWNPQHFYSIFFGLIQLNITQISQKHKQEDTIARFSYLYSTFLSLTQWRNMQLYCNITSLHIFIQFTSINFAIW